MITPIPETDDLKAQIYQKEKATAAPMASMAERKRILVPVDFSKARQHTLDFASTLAAKFRVRCPYPPHQVDFQLGRFDFEFMLNEQAQV